MNSYFILKFIHIITATFLFGTGVGTAFFMLSAYISRDVAALKRTTKHVVLADWLFTAPSVVLQPITGVLLMWLLHYPFNSLWFVMVVGLYVFIGCCWLPVVYIQYQLRNQVAVLEDNALIPASYHRLMRWWVGLGVPAFVSVTLLYWLMVSKSGLSVILFSI